MSKKAIGFVVCLCLVPTATLFAQQLGGIPDVSLNVAARQKTDGSEGKAIHVFQLNCSNGDCVLTTVTLDQCFEVGGKSVFMPKIEMSSTRDGNLTIKQSSGKLELIEKLSGTTGDFNAQYLFEFTPGGMPITKLTSFSGGYTKSSSLLNRILVTEFVPLMGKWSNVELDCNTITLMGIPTELDY